MPLEIIDCEQGSAEWSAARLGIVTASNFGVILGIKKDAKEKATRQTYIRKLAGEIITGESMDSYNNAYMDRGKAYEQEARDQYAFMNDCEPKLVGFLKDGRKGASPDSLIGEVGGLEIKVALPHIQIERLEKNEFPSEHKPQVQGNIWISKRDWWDFVSYCPGLPLFVKKVERDDKYISELSEGTEKFIQELDDLVSRIRNYKG